MTNIKKYKEMIEVMDSLIDSLNELVLYLKEEPDDPDIDYYENFLDKCKIVRKILNDTHNEINK